MASAPLPTMLSQALVAFTIEFDNEAEHRMAHSTTRHGGTERGAVWLTSQVMWANTMRYVPEGGITVAELSAAARTARLQLGGLARWGYIRLDGKGGDRADTVVRCTAKGRIAQEHWRPLAGVIERRWDDRFGAVATARLRTALHDVVARVGLDLPRYIPLVFPSQNGRAEPVTAPPQRERPEEDIDLSVLLARALLAYTLDFESESKVSLTTCANTLRVLTPAGVRVRDLPRLTGVSKEGNAMATGFLARIDCAELVADPSAPRGKIVRLTEKGQRVQANYRRVLASTEQRWQERFGAGRVAALRSALEPLVGQGTAAESPLFGGLEPYPDNWRAKVRRPTLLPHYPMVLHRGGYPDGS